MSHLKQAKDQILEQENTIGELLHQARATFSISLGKIITEDPKNRKYTVYLFDDDREVDAILVKDINNVNIGGNYKPGTYVLVMHKLTLSALIIDKIANDRIFTRDSNHNNKNNNYIPGALYPNA